MSFLGKLLFFPSLLATMMTDDNWYDRIDNCVMIGALPFRSTIEKLISEQNVKGILSMNEKFETNALWYPSSSELLRQGVSFLQLPVVDYVGHATWNQAQKGLTYIDNICATNGTVYVHCKAGKFRSALMTATYLMHKYNATPQEAEYTLKTHRHQISLQESETVILEEFYNRMHPEAKKVTISDTIRNK